MDFYHIDFWFCIIVAVVAAILIKLVDNDSEDFADKEMGKAIIFIFGSVIIGFGILAAIIKWIF